MLSYIFTGLLAHNLLNIATAQSKPYVLLNQHPLSPLASPTQNAAAVAHLAAAAGQNSANWLAAHGQFYYNTLCNIIVLLLSFVFTTNLHVWVLGVLGWVSFEC